MVTHNANGGWNLIIKRHLPCRKYGTARRFPECQPVFSLEPRQHWLENHIRKFNLYFWKHPPREFTRIQIPGSNRFNMLLKTFHLYCLHSIHNHIHPTWIFHLPTSILLYPGLFKSPRNKKNIFLTFFL